MLKPPLRKSGLARWTAAPPPLRRISKSNVIIKLSPYARSTPERGAQLKPHVPIGIVLMKRLAYAGINLNFHYGADARESMHARAETSLQEGEREGAHRGNTRERGEKDRNTKARKKL